MNTAGLDINKKAKLQLNIKRFSDVTFSTILLLLLSPFLSLIATAIKLSSAGPAIYAQKRIGLKEQEFVFYKFRSMHTKQSQMVSQHIDALKPHGVLYKEANDPRITSIGRYLRKTSLDELPQLLNILKGDMSFVGPRPLLPFMLLPLSRDQREKRASLRPGLTGLWQIRDRAKNTQAEHMIRHDVEYIDSFSLILDIKIILATFVHLFTGEGAC